MGLASSLVLAASFIPAITMAPVLITGAIVSGVAAGGYSIFRSSSQLADRTKHKQVSFFVKPSLTVERR